MRWKLGLAIASGTLVVGLGSAVLFNGLAYGEWDLDGLNQQVQHVTEVTDNHEARISNVESKVDTPVDQPTPAPQAVPVVTTPTALPPAPVVTPTPVPASPTVLSVQLVCKDNEQWQVVSYSDNTQSEHKLFIGDKVPPCDNSSNF